ncbi:MAG: DNA utilization protein GntX [Desulfuromonas sp.]|nr:MAG: DNA utilization protein GntX [Desulfuromonas sp.]
MSLLLCLQNDVQACIDLFLPAACPWCNRLLPGDRAPDDICPTCQQGVQPLPSSHCPCCAQPHATRSATRHYCENCLRRPPHFSKVYAVGCHIGTLKETIHRFKYRDNPGLSSSLGKLMIAELTTNLGHFRPDLVIPTPLHPRRLRQRGYQQALELAKPVAKHLHTPLEIHLLQRIKTTPPQQGQNAADRQGNLHKAFASNRVLSGEQILLIDDVMTTATTARECSKTLKEHGAGEIHVAVLGRA